MHFLCMKQRKETMVNKVQNTFQGIRHCPLFSSVANSFRKILSFQYCQLSTIILLNNLNQQISPSKMQKFLRKERKYRRGGEVSSKSLKPYFFLFYLKFMAYFLTMLLAFSSIYSQRNRHSLATIGELHLKNEPRLDHFLFPFFFFLLNSFCSNMYYNKIKQKIHF